MNLWNNRHWKPMLLKETDKPFNSDEYLFEIKLDGVRAIIFASPNEVKIMNRKYNDITHLYPELQKIKELVKENTIFDGEIVTFENDKPSFQKLQERTHLKDKKKIEYQSINNPVIFICFDVIYKGKNLTHLSLLKRKQILKEFKENEYFSKLSHIENDGIELFKKIKKRNLEGIVAKLKNSLYEIDIRTNNWLKIKNLYKEKFIIGGYIERKTNIVSLVLGEYRNNYLYYVGKVTITKQNSLYKKIVKMKIKTNNFINYEDDNVTFIKPELECYAEYLERTENNHLRQPVYREK